MATTGNPVEIEFVARADQISTELWTDCFPHPLEGYFWYQALESCGIEDQFRFCYALLRRDGRAIGIAPCFLHDVPITLVAPPHFAAILVRLSRVFPRVGYQRTFFVGSPCSDEGTIGLVPGIQLVDVAGSLIRAVQLRARELGAPMLVFKDFREHDVAALRLGGALFSTVSYPGTTVRLPPGGKEAYLRGLSHNQRHNFLKKLRRSRELLPLTASVVAHPSDQEIAEIFGLFGQTYERGKTKFERLTPDFFHQIRAATPVRFLLLRRQSDGALVAFMLLFHLGDRVINKFIGLDYRQDPKSYLYFRLFDTALDFVAAAGATELQSGQTGYRAKLDLGHRLVPLCNLFRHANPLVNVVFRAIGRRVSWGSLDPDLRNFLRAHPKAEPGHSTPRTGHT